MHVENSDNLVLSTLASLNRQRTKELFKLTAIRRNKMTSVTTLKEVEDEEAACIARLKSINDKVTWEVTRNTEMLRERGLLE
jgi:hypothetical protein